MGYTWQEAREAFHGLKNENTYNASMRVLDSYFQMGVKSVPDDEREPVPIERITFDPSCPTRQEQDEYVCAKCLMRWDVREDKPPCRRPRT